MKNGRVRAWALLRCPCAEGIGLEVRSLHRICPAFFATYLLAQSFKTRLEFLISNNFFRLFYCNYCYIILHQFLWFTIPLLFLVLTTIFTYEGEHHEVTSHENFLVFNVFWAGPKIDVCFLSSLLG